MLDTDKIVGLQVVGIKDGKVLGQVTQVVCDLASGDMLGLILGKGAAEKGVLAQDIKTIGEDAVMVSDSSAARHLSELPELMQRRRDPSQGPILVLTDDGTRLGHLSRIWVDPEGKKVTRYEVSPGLLRTLTKGTLLLPVVPGSVHGEDTLVVPAEELVGLSVATGGLKAQLEQIGARLREEAAAAREQAEKAARAAKEQAEKAAEAARQQASKAAESVREQRAKTETKPEEEEAREAEQSSEEPTATAEEVEGDQQPAGEEGTLTEGEAPATEEQTEAEAGEESESRPEE